MSDSVAGRSGGGTLSARMSSIAEAARYPADHPPLVIAALFAITAAVAAYFTAKVTTFEPDALGYTHIAIAIGDHPTLLTDAAGGHDRLNQLYPLSIAPLYRLFSNVTAFQLSHVWNSILMASAVIPIYLLARSVLATRRLALAAAAVAAVFPWLTLSSSQLTEVVAYPACAWSLFAMQRALVRPSWRADALVILSVVVASYGRLQLGILGPVFVVTVLLHELGWALTTGAADDDRRTALRRAGRRLLRGHALLVVATALAALAFVALVAAGRVQSSFGFYGNTLAGQLLPTGMWTNARSNITFLTWGVGVLPMVLTIGVVLRCVVAAPERRLHAFSCLTVVTFASIVIAVARINAIFIGAVVQERYVMFVVPLLAVGLLVGLAELRRPALTVALGAVVLLPLVATTDYEMIPSSFWFLVSPGMTWFFETISTRLDRISGFIGADDLTRFHQAAWAIGLACVVVAGALVAGARRQRLVTATLVGAVFLLCSVSTVYSLGRVVDGSARYGGLGRGTVAGNDWIDHAVGRDTPVTLLATQLGQISDSREAWTTAEFWNRSLRSAFAISTPFTTWNAAPVVPVTPAGRIPGAGSPRYVVTATRGTPVELAGREIARSPDGTLRLLDTGARPLRTTWSIDGISDDGWLPVGRAATLRTDTDGGRCRTLRMTLFVPKGAAQARVLQVRGAGLDRRVVVTPRGGPPLVLRACGAGPLKLTARVPLTAPDLGATIRVVSVSVAGA